MLLLRLVGCLAVWSHVADSSVLVHMAVPAVDPLHGLHGCDVLAELVFVFIASVNYLINIHSPFATSALEANASFAYSLVVLSPVSVL